jgi:Protein of unknown function (DUF4038)/Putative collagen-binding domain of a collagenase
MNQRVSMPIRALTFGLAGLCLAVSGAIILSISSFGSADPVRKGKSGSLEETGQFMTLSADRTHLVNTFTNKPVFISGDTAYNLVTQPASDADVEAYLSNRQAKGINLIWVGLVDATNHGKGVHLPGSSPGEGNTQTNAHGDSPWNGGADFTGMETATAYWDHVDDVLKRASAHGITVLAGTAFTGTFDKCDFPYYRSMMATPDAALRAYGAFLGGRYKSYPNVIWLLGGDANVKLCGSNLAKKIDDIARGILSADSRHLMAIEATNGVWGEASTTSWSSSTFGPDNPSGWLTLGTIYPKGTPDIDFSAEIEQIVFQSATEIAASPFVPFFSVEDSYEYEPWSGHAYNAQQLRQQAYTEVLSGAILGRLFGSAGVWPFGAGCCQYGSKWKAAMDHPASFDQQRVGQLFRSREHWKLVPDTSHSVVTAGFGSGSTLAVTARTSDGQTIIAYVPNGNRTTLTVDMEKITSNVHQAAGWWFNPASGLTKRLGTFANSGKRDFTAPDTQDWVLVIDDPEANLPAPGGTER